ncbi:MAG: FecR family protein [Niabella sp.]
MTEADYRPLVEKFLADQCDHAEAERVVEYLQNNPTALDQIVLIEDLSEHEIITVSNKQKVKTLRHILGGQQKILSIKKWIAAASILFLIGFFIFLILPKSHRQNVTVSAVSEDITLTNTTKEVQKYLLPDSSSILLEPEAEILVNNNFKTNRLIKITRGDVFFKVAKDTAHPFRVITQGIETIALGTAFWVKSMPQSSYIAVSLNEGSVVIAAEEDDIFKMQPVYLKPEHTCAINKTTGKVEVYKTIKPLNQPRKEISVNQKGSENPKINSIEWTNEEIVFSNVSLGHVFARLEKKYNVTIIVNDKAILKPYLTGKIFYSDSLNVLLQSICDLNKLTYEKKDDTILIKQK